MLTRRVCPAAQRHGVPGRRRGQFVEVADDLAPVGRGGRDRPWLRAQGDGNGAVREPRRRRPGRRPPLGAPARRSAPGRTASPHRRSRSVAAAAVAAACGRSRGGAPPSGRARRESRVRRTAAARAGAARPPSRPGRGSPGPARGQPSRAGARGIEPPHRTHHPARSARVWATAGRAPPAGRQAQPAEEQPHSEVERQGVPPVEGHVEQPERGGRHGEGSDIHPSGTAVTLPEHAAQQHLLGDRHGGHHDGPPRQCRERQRAAGLPQVDGEGHRAEHERAGAADGNLPRGRPGARARRAVGAAAMASRSPANTSPAGALRTPAVPASPTRTASAPARPATSAAAAEGLPSPAAAGRAGLPRWSGHRRRCSQTAALTTGRGVTAAPSTAARAATG